jgi:hypothetical protein
MLTLVIPFPASKSRAIESLNVPSYRQNALKARPWVKLRRLCHHALLSVERFELCARLKPEKNERKAHVRFSSRMCGSVTAEPNVNTFVTSENLAIV